MTCMSDTMETFVPMVLRPRHGHRAVAGDQPLHNVALLQALARAFYWQRLIDTGAMRCPTDIAQAEGLQLALVNEMLRLTLLAPDIVERALAGRQPQRLTPAWCQRNRCVDWAVQRQLVRRLEEPS